MIVVHLILAVALRGLPCTRGQFSYSSEEQALPVPESDEDNEDIADKPFSLEFIDDYEDDDSGLEECLELQRKRQQTTMTKMIPMVTSPTRNLSSPPIVMENLAVSIEQSVQQHQVWNNQGRIVAAKVSRWMKYRRWRQPCVVCCEAPRAVTARCADVLRYWLSRLTTPYMLNVVILPYVFNYPSKEEIEQMRIVEAQTNSFAFHCNFIVLLVERPNHALSLALFEKDVWNPVTSQVVVLLDSPPSQMFPPQNRSTLPREASRQVRSDMVGVLQRLWHYRRVHRVVVYQTSRPSRFLAVNVIEQRTRNICVADDFGYWEFLAFNMTNLHGLPVYVTMFGRNGTAVPQGNRTNPRVRALTRRGWKGPVFLGMDAWLLRIFADTLNFTPVVHRTSDGKTFGYRKNGTYYGSLRDLVLGYADIAFNQHFILDYNSADVMYSFPVDFDSLCVDVPHFMSMPRWAQLVRGFDPITVTTYIALSYVVVGLFWYLNSWSARPLPFQRSFWLVHGVLCGAPAPFIPKRSSQRVLIGACALFSVIATNAFQGIASMTLAQPHNLPQINTLQELADSDLIIMTGSASLEATTFAGDSEVHRRLIKKIYVPRDEEEWERLSNSSRAAKLLRRNSASPQKVRHLVRECPRHYFLSYMLPHDSPFLDPFNKMLSQLQAAGILEYLKAISYRNIKVAEWSASPGAQIHFNDVKGAVYLLFACNSLAIFNFGLELLSFRVGKYMERRRARLQLLQFGQNREKEKRRTRPMRVRHPAPAPAPAAHPCGKFRLKPGPRHPLDPPPAYSPPRYPGPAYSPARYPVPAASWDWLQRRARVRDTPPPTYFIH